MSTDRSCIVLAANWSGRGFFFQLAGCSMLFLAGCSGDAPSELRVAGPEAVVTESNASSVAVTIRNVGDDVFRILSVESSCGCTIVGDDIQSEVPGGASLSVPLSVNTSFWGAKQVVVSVATDAEVSPVQKVDFRVEGIQPQPPFAAEKSYLIELRAKPEEESADASLVLMTFEKRDSDPWLAGIESSSDNVDVSLNCTSSEDMAEELVRRRYEVLVGVGADIEKADGKQFRLQLKTSGTSEHRPPEVVVAVDVVERLEVFPPSIVIRRGQKTKERHRVMFVSSSEEPIAVSVAKTLPDGVEIFPVDVANAVGQIYDVQFDWSRIASSEAIQEIVFETDNGDLPSVRVPVLRSGNI